MNVCTEYGTLERGIITSALEYLEENPGIKTFVIGISGGVDSALCAALAREVADLNGGIKVIGASIPITTNGEDEIARAQKVGEAFLDEFIEKDMGSEFTTMVASLMPTVHGDMAMGKEIDVASRVRLGNIKARLRMTYLYDLAQANNGLVLSTDNYTEYNLGFWTLHGDVGDLGFFQELWKTEVYGLADHMKQTYNSAGQLKRCYALMECINAVPTDGLGVSDNDLSQLLPDYKGEDWRAAYATVDAVLIDRLDATHSFPADHPVNVRHTATAFKRANPVSFKREFLTWVHNGGSWQKGTAQ